MQSLKRIRSAALASLATLLALHAVSATPDISGTWLPVDSLAAASRVLERAISSWSCACATWCWAAS